MSGQVGQLSLVSTKNLAHCYVILYILNIRECSSTLCRDALETKWPPIQCNVKLSSEDTTYLVLLIISSYNIVIIRCYSLISLPLETCLLVKTSSLYSEKLRSMMPYCFLMNVKVYLKQERKAAMM